MQEVHLHSWVYHEVHSPRYVSHFVHSTPANIYAMFLACIVDYAYEDAQKRTYLPMLIQVGIYLPLLVGFFLLYPWLGGSRKITFSQQTDDAENEEKTKLLARDSGVGNSQ